MIKIEQRLLNAPHCHLVGLVKGQQDCGKERPVHLGADTKALVVLNNGHMYDNADLSCEQSRSQFYTRF